MQKPNSMPIKEFLIKKLSLSLIIPEKVIGDVILHQFESATSAVVNHNSVEFSGFGKFLFNVKKAQKSLDKLYEIKNAYNKQLQKEDVTEEQIKEVTNRIKSVEVKINSLTKKINKDGEI